MTSYVPAADQSDSPAGDHVVFHARLSADNTLCLFDVEQRRPGGAHLSLEFGRAELGGLIATLNAMLDMMSGAPGRQAPPVPSIGRDIALGQLTERERDVVEGLRRGERLTSIAKRLFISVHTARNHLKHVFRKLGMHSQNELIATLGGRP